MLNEAKHLYRRLNQMAKRFDYYPERDASLRSA